MFLWVQFPMLSCDTGLLMVWLGLGTKPLVLDDILISPITPGLNTMLVIVLRSC